MGNFVFATVLLAIIIIFTAVNSVRICDICDDMLALIDAGNTEEAIALWSEERDYLAIFVRDAEIDVVSAEADALGESIALEDGEAEMGAMRLREAITELRNSEKPSFQDIF